MLLFYYPSETEIFHCQLVHPLRMQKQADGNKLVIARYFMEILGVEFSHS